MLTWLSQELSIEYITTEVLSNTSVLRAAYSLHIEQSLFLGGN